MQLSEAIRLGSMISKPAIGTVNDGNGGRCAIGTAFLAVSSDVWQPDWIPQGKLVPVPGRPCAMTVHGAIVWLNDFARWSRHDIADWVERIEKRQEAISEPQLVPVSTALYD